MASPRSAGVRGGGEANLLAPRPPLVFAAVYNGLSVVPAPRAWPSALGWAGASLSLTLQGLGFGGFLVFGTTGTLTSAPARIIDLPVFSVVHLRHSHTPLFANTHTCTEARAAPLGGARASVHVLSLIHI